MLIQLTIEFKKDHLVPDLKPGDKERFIEELDDLHNLIAKEREHKRQLEELDIDELVFSNLGTTHLNPTE